MKIAAIGPQNRIDGLKNIISSAFSVVQDITDLSELDVFFDLEFDLNHSTRCETYCKVPNTVFFLSAVNVQAEQVLSSLPRNFVGKLVFFNAIPGFLDKPALEVSQVVNIQKEEVNQITQLLGWKQVEYVDSRIGMVAPRIVFMIVNEAYFTVQEKTASRSDINLGMKLGTNYPNGPFEWVEICGLDNIYLTLEAIFNDTRDERYKICPLLKSEYLTAKTPIA